MTKLAEARRSVAITVAPCSRFDAAHDCGISRGLDVRPETHELERVHETILEDRLGDYRRAIGNGVERHELRLHVGREARVRGRAHIDALWRAAHFDSDRAFVRGNARSRLAQLFDYGVGEPRIGISERDCAARRRGGDQKRTRLDAVRHDPMRGSVEALDALDRDDVGTGAGDARSHRVEALR